MSNFIPTVGRNIQYINSQNLIQAAIISAVKDNGMVDITVFPAYNPSVGSFMVENVKPYVVGERNQTDVYLLNWQGR